MDDIEIMWNVIKKILGTDNIIELKEQYNLDGSGYDTDRLYEKIYESIVQPCYDSVESIDIARKTLEIHIKNDTINR